ncbi:MAG: signal peptidase I [Myxococcota bacterium]|jgi:signal peptidase I
MKRIIGAIAATLAVLVLLALLPLRQVGSDEMAWTFQPGDYVWIVPDTTFKGDVVLMDDPLDPSRTVLRRVVALAGDKVKYEDGGLRVNGKRVRQNDMGERDSVQVYKEVIWSRPPARATNWFIQRVKRPVLWTLDGPVTIPSGHVYVMADSRDEALDSRWWGPVPTSALKGVVRARLGTADDWRGAVEWMRPIDQPSTAEVAADEAAEAAEAAEAGT